MSSKSTENLGLHAWERTDPFRMDEFNENFDKLDRAVGANAAAVHTIPKFTYGTYTGNGKKNQFIELPFTPKMVHVGDAAGRTFYNGGGMALKGRNNDLVGIVEGGFQVTYTTSNNANSKDKEYLYFAIG